MDGRRRPVHALPEYGARHGVPPETTDWLRDPSGALRIVPAKLAGALSLLSSEGHVVVGAPKTADALAVVGVPNPSATIELCTERLRANLEVVK